MAKGLRSKIKRKWRTELRSTLGAHHEQIKFDKIQAQLKKAIDSQTAGKSLAGLRSALQPAGGMEMEDDKDKVVVTTEENETEGSVATGVMNMDASVGENVETVEKRRRGTKRTVKKSRFVHFHKPKRKGD